MRYKRIITGGCSFSDRHTSNGKNWPHILEDQLSRISFNHTGMGSRGQELIQKNLSIALIEDLEIYDPSEIAIIVMWSGTERKSFFVDNTYCIQDIVNNWADKRASTTQFADLHGIIDNSKTHDMEVFGQTLTTYYNPLGGWYTCNYLISDSKLSDEYFNTMGSTIGPSTISLENIIMLQNLCKLKGVSLYHAFYKSYVYDDIYQNKDHLNLNYLYRQWDLDTIISTTGMYEHFRPEVKNKLTMFSKLFEHILYSDNNAGREFFQKDSIHPNEIGATKWVNEVLVPFLRNKGFFDDESARTSND